MKDSRDNVSPPLSNMSIANGGVTFEVEGEKLAFYVELQGVERQKFATFDPEFFGPKEDVADNLDIILAAMYELFLKGMAKRGHVVLEDGRKKKPKQ